MPYTISVDGTSSFSAEEGDTVLTAALRANVGFPYDCSSGGCGGCRFELVKGSVEELWADAPGLSARDRKKGKRLACQCVAGSDLEIKVRTSDEFVPPLLPSRQRGRVVGTRDVTHDMREVTVMTPGPARFRPGQYALLSFEGLARPRAYSMSNLPNEDGIWRFIIRRVPGGTFTGHLFDAVTTGDELCLDGPYGMAWLREDVPREVLCISGGSGLAPMLSVARGALAAPSIGHIHFYFGARTPADVIGQQELDFLVAQTVPSTQRLVVSNPDPSWDGPRGFVHELVEKELGDRLETLEIYLAGPPAMVDAVQEMLFIRHKVSVHQVHLDRFF